MRATLELMVVNVSNVHHTRNVHQIVTSWIRASHVKVDIMTLIRTHAVQSVILLHLREQTIED